MASLFIPEAQASLRDPAEQPTLQEACRPASGARIRWFTDSQSLQPFIGAWDTLSECASEPNVFFESWYLLPALELLRGTADVRIGLITQPGRHGHEHAIGLFPMEHIRPNARAPLGGLRMWRHSQCFLCTPLMLPGREETCWELLLNELDSGRFGKMLELPVLSADGPVCEALSQVCRERRPLEIQSIYRRATMELAADGATYLRKGSIARREYARKRRKLEQMGYLQTQSLDRAEDHTPWLEEFLALEARGWKGAANSALACNSADRAFITRIAQAAHERERLMMLALRLDGHLIAGEINLVGTRQSSFGLKIAFDEQYAECSPGMVLALDGIEIMHTERRVRWIDCCCAVGNNSIQRLWNEQRVITTLALPSAGCLSRFFFASLPLARQFRRVLRPAG